MKVSAKLLGRVVLASAMAGLTGCDDDAKGRAEDDRADASARATNTDLPIVQPPNAEAAARGARLFTEGSLGAGFIPKQALRYLWLVWGGPSLGDDEFFAKFRARYGFVEAPFDNDGYPLGIRSADASSVAIDCLACHASRVAGETSIGTGNSELDLQLLFDDLVKLRETAKSAGITVPELAHPVVGRTGAPGANDAFGLGMSLAAAYDPRAPKVHERAGFQQAPSWWSLRYRKRMYLDGSGQPGGYRTMMATLLISGTPLATLQARDAAFADLYQYILSLDAPKWTLSPLDEAKRERGRVVFDATCASCHGVHTGADASFPDRVVDPGEVGTDATRAQSFDADDAAWINGTWFGGNGEAPWAMTATGAYLAPPLVGVWASAPYFHNGSVPDLAAVLDPSLRPQRWQRTGSDKLDYDVERVGWRTIEVTTTPSDPIAARRIYDTTKPGLGNGGHTFGAALSAAQRVDLLEYLRSL